jgi:uncharacterized BrkB/YihY/UPF0761 family membrane protein
MTDLFGLPAHILLLHTVVILAPLAGLLALVYSWVPAVRKYTGWALFGLAVLNVPFALFTKETGEQFEEQRPENALIEAHAALGDLLPLISLLFLVAAALLFVAYDGLALRLMPWLAKARAVPALKIAVSVLASAVAVWFIYQTIVTGHSGALAVWSGN